MESKSPWTLEKVKKHYERHYLALGGKLPSNVSDETWNVLLGIMNEGVELPWRIPDVQTVAKLAWYTPYRADELVASDDQVESLTKELVATAWGEKSRFTVLNSDGTVDQAASIAAAQHFFFGPNIPSVYDGEESNGLRFDYFEEVISCLRKSKIPYRLFPIDNSLDCFTGVIVTDHGYAAYSDTGDFDPDRSFISDWEVEIL